MFDYKTYKPIGVRAVDSVVACVYQHRKLGIPLKSIFLKPAAWIQWDNYWRRIKETHAQENDITGDDLLSIYQFDGVNIEKGSILQRSDLSVELYLSKASEA